MILLIVYCPSRGFPGCVVGGGTGFKKEDEIGVTHLWLTS